ncbi:MAG: class I SAM-dependent methyltransferase [Oscillospiraceae bacterium]|nr:class I SAM-dependent methyltransferase [Oscillospiraceae bacterium]MCI9363523.1 class I SAM-dependent methyltransferase [Oscillospiraceae bacterium]RKJ59065.1 class I SAM-dependent methyltransferase [bacterium 1XD42-8]RKJ67250.1 class I SAM-dependent methyltransferase [bacterium 1XD42-1]
MEKEAMIAYFDSIASQWDTLAPHDDSKIRCLVTLGITPGARVLDIGCGTGVLTPFLLETKPAYLLGIDLSSGMIQRAKEKYGNLPVEFLAGDVMELSQPNSFDCAILYDAFPQFENRGSLIRQINYLLAPKGRLMICSGFNRHVVNAPYKGGSAVSIPLPAAKTLASTLDKYFEVDTIIDSPSLYAVSGMKRQAV